MGDILTPSTISVPSRHKWIGLAWKSIAWAVLIGSIIYYVRRDALHYLFYYTQDSFKAFWSERILIRIHVACAVTMISTGTLQFWTGLRMRNITFHVWFSAVVVLRRFRASDAHEDVEERAARVAGALLFALAAYVAIT
jgi:hypothetical protein